MAHDGEGRDTQKNADSVVLKVADLFGNEYLVDCHMDVQNDIPEAKGDHMETTSGEPAGIAGSITVDFGADNGDCKSATINGQEMIPGAEILSAHGKLVLGEDNSYVYYANAKGADDEPENQDIFEVVVKDADGDVASANIIINIKKPDGHAFDPIFLDESDFENGNVSGVLAMPGYDILGIVTTGKHGHR